MNKVDTSSEQSTRKGLMLVLSSPSGAGKTTAANLLRHLHPGLSFSVSATTRSRRPGEVDGKDYHFITEERFKALKEKGELLEEALVFGHYYGTPRAPVEAALAGGQDIIFDVDWQGARSLVKEKPEDVVSIFILPPSWEELEKRLYGRAQDTDTVIKNRMDKAASEIAHWVEYDYVIVNRNIRKTVEALSTILQAERLKKVRQKYLEQFTASLKPSSR